MRREQGQMLSRHEGKALHGSSRHLSQAASHQAVEGNPCRGRRGAPSGKVYILSGCGRWGREDDLCVGLVLVAVRENAPTGERVC